MKRATCKVGDDVRFRRIGVARAESDVDESDQEKKAEQVNTGSKDRLRDKPASSFIR